MAKEIANSVESAPRSILFLIDQLVALDGGAEGTLLKMTRLLPQYRYRPQIATFKTDGNSGILREFPCPVHVFPMQRTYDWNALRIAFRLGSFVRKERIRIVQTFFETSDLWGGLVAKLHGCPVVISSRRDMGFQRSAKHNLAYRVLAPLFDQVQTVSEAVRQSVIRQDRFDPERVVTVHNGVDLDRTMQSDTRQLRASLRLEDASHLIVDIGWIRRVKGTDLLIRTAAAVCREFPKAVFLVIGDNDDRSYFQELSQLIESLRLGSNFRFLGAGKDVFEILKICDVFCHLSRTDGLSNALLEAMACGLPCVITDVGGNSEALEEGKSGFLVRPERSDSAADRVLYLLRNIDCAKRIGDRGREIVKERFTTEIMMGRLARLYDDLLDREPQSARQMAS